MSPVPLLALVLTFGVQDTDPTPLPETLPGVNNIREVAGVADSAGRELRPRVLLRCSSLARATPEAVEALHAYGVKTLVDLRTMVEIADRGMPPAPYGRKPILVHLPTDVETWTNDKKELYAKLWNENGHVASKLITLLADPANHPVVLHGELGADRVGIFVAMVLELAGVPREAIVADYLNYRGRLTPLRSNLEVVFGIWDAYEGGLVAWLAEKAYVHPLSIHAMQHTLKSAEPYAKSSDEKAADKLFAKAVKTALGGNYPSAVKAYEKVAKKYPTTQSGIEAAQRAQPNAFLSWTELVNNGPSSNRVDIVLMGEGYTVKHAKTFDKQVKNVPKFFSEHSIFGEYYTYHNILRASLVSEEDCVDKLHEDNCSTVLNGHDSGALQGQVAVDHDRVMRQLEELPEHDGLAVVFAKRGTGGTGGGGVATVGGLSFATLLHEWGHAFASLVDEYTTDVGYRGPVRSGPNVSDSSDPTKVSWKHWLDVGAKDVKVVEGAAGRAKGAWKSTVKGCAMEGGTEFCRVCREALILRIYSIVDPIEACAPEDHAVAELDPFMDPLPPIEATEPLTFEVTVMQPASHDIDVRWWVLPEHLAPPAPVPTNLELRYGDRRDRGRLFVIESAPEASTKGKKGVHRFKMDPKGRKPGRYRVVCRAQDTTRVDDKEDWPWVLLDPRHVLQSERAWWVVVP